MALNITETIKYMIDNTAGVDIDELIDHLNNKKKNRGEVVEEKKEEVNKLKERILCKECNINIIKTTKSRHYKTKKHLNNVNNNRKKEGEERDLMILEDTNINDIPPPVPPVVQVQEEKKKPDYMNSKYYNYDEVEEFTEGFTDYIIRRIYYDPAITDMELIKLHPHLLTKKYVVVKYRTAYTIVIITKKKGLIF